MSPDIVVKIGALDFEADNRIMVQARMIKATVDRWDAHQVERDQILRWIIADAIKILEAAGLKIVREGGQP